MTVADSETGQRRGCDEPGVTIAAVIPNWNQAELTRACIESVQHQVAHVFVVDNGSAPADRSYLEESAPTNTTVIVSQTNRGYAGGCNIGARAALAAGFTAVLIMNNDAFADPGSVRTLVDALRVDPGLAAVAPAVVERGTRGVLHASCSINERTGRTAWRGRGMATERLGRLTEATGYLSGEAILIRSRALEDIGGFDERYFCYYEDVDWSLRARAAGWRLAVAPTAVFEHVVSASSSGLAGVYYRARNMAVFLRIARRRGRFGALLWSAPAEIHALMSLLKRGHVHLAVAGVLRGWIHGAMMNI